ncbi:protein NDUFAF4 homolog [Contarinia nasturtii]|uniref:protein NDUFAF4 homolog n=1 Tax=Contarinia nasturtii TaxID=265458 RepID=UPI0012D4C1E8|nr:protein NDUFAF4 homolog [Contarinia nasturtii]
MGNYMSNNTLYLSAKRLVSKYNIESRVSKELDKQAKKPVIAPKHEAGIIDYHKSLQENKDYLDKTTVVDPKLDLHLKDVYVTSKGLTENIKSDKPLPLSRFSERFELGYKESERVPPGRVSLLQAINFITKHQQDPKEWTVERIAEENKIKPDVASDILEYFRSFEVHMSKNITPKEQKMLQDNLKLLGGGKSSTE